MKRKKELMVLAGKLYSLGLELESTRQRLKDLVAHGAAYDSPVMVKTLTEFQEKSAQWDLLEAQYLKLRNQRPHGT